MAQPPEPKELLRELRETARELGGAPRSGLEDLLARRHRLRKTVVGLVWSEELAGALREHLAHVESRLERIEGEAAGTQDRSLEVLQLRGDLSWLPMLFPDGRLEETLVSLDAETGAVAHAVAALAEAGEGRAAEAMDLRRAATLEVKKSRLGHRASTLVSEETPSRRELWVCYLDALDLEDEQKGAGREVAELLRARLVSRVEGLPIPEAAEGLTRFAAEFEDRSLETLARQVEFPPAKAARDLDRARREMAWLRVLITGTIGRADKRREEHREPLRELKSRSRRLRRAAARLRREAQETRLQGRLEGIFGTRFVAFFENLILWLIFVVLFVLLLQAVLPDPHPTAEIPIEAWESARWFEPHVGVRTWVDAHADAHYWRPFHRVLAWLDALICGVFLLEFFGKLALVRGRFSWFLRHFLVDLIPSIPYGLITANALDALRLGRLARFARLARLLRYMRVARPLVRFMRVFGFMQRASDRLVRLHGDLMNRRVVLFEPAPIEEVEVGAGEVRRQLRHARTVARKVWRRVSQTLPPALQAERLARFLSDLPPTDALMALPHDDHRRSARPANLLRAEELVDQLTVVDPGTVDAELGLGGAKRLASTLERIDVPLIRSFPFLKPMIRAVRELHEGGALEKVAAAGKALGRYLEKLLGRVHWLSDLSGVITGPQFLDRLGTGMVQATARPARRLLLFGVAFLLLKALVHLLGLTALQGIADGLGRVLGLPFIILGLACLVTLLLGSWFRRVAGEATDFYIRTAEAQYINLLKSVKLANLAEDLQILWERTLRPEELIAGRTPEPGDGDLRECFETRGTVSDGRERHDRVLQLYDDYLDGAVFHHTDTKTSSQLLGNLALENIRAERLAVSRRERKRLDSLDLDRERSVLRGPYFWFRSINHSVAQWTAKLILEYNRQAIPLADRATCPPPVIDAFERWLDGRIREERVGEAGAEGGDSGAFVTTSFTALHFLTASEARDRTVSERFGERTLKALITDRRAMIRTIFGTYPSHRLPRAARTVNPFDLYARHLGGGRVLLLPLYFLYGLLWVLRWLIRRVRATLREILSSSPIEADPQANWATYDVAVRKIHRMRKPLYMECARFRAMFDPEYLGLSLLPEVESGMEGRTYREDLERIGARSEEWDEFTEIREERSRALRELGEMVDTHGGPESYVRGLRGERAEPAFAEAWRAVAIAYAIDYRGARSLAMLRRRATELVSEAVRLRGRVPGAGLLGRLVRLFIPSRRLKRSLAEFLPRFGGGLSPRERRWVWRAVRADLGGLGGLVRAGAALAPGTEPEEASRGILAGVATHPEAWSEQLFTLRAVQALSVLDVRNYRRQVWKLGGYENE